MEFEVAAPGSVVVKRSCERIEGAAYVSISHQGQHWKRQRGKADATKTPISCEVAVSLAATRQRAKDGLPALRVEVGPNTLEICSGIMFQSRGVRFTR